MGDLSNAQLVESWELSLHGKSPGTKKLYLEVVRAFVRWLDGHERRGDLVAVTRQDAEAWFAAQRDAGLSPSTVRSRWIALRNLYGWALEEGEVVANPLARVRVDRPAAPPPDLLTDTEVSALLDSCRTKNFLDVRDLALLRLMLATGLRRAEVVDLRLVDIDLRARVAHVRHGKGDRPRVVRFDPATAAAIDRYKRLRARHRLAERTDRVWLSHMGSITVKGLNAVLANRARKAGVENVHPHRLRHSFADRAKAAGLSDEDVMTLGGWTDSSVMRRYGAARATDRALAAYDTANVMGEL